jgi:4-hydroxyproline epimerase
VGIPLSGERLPELRRMAREIIVAIAAAPPAAARPESPPIALNGVVFTGPPQHPDAHLRAVTVTEGGAVNRSPGGTAMTAVMSVLDAMGLLPDDRPFVQEGLIGSVFHGRVLSRTMVGVLPAIVAEVEGRAWITGEHTLLTQDDDPFREGFTI